MHRSTFTHLAMPFLLLAAACPQSDPDLETETRTLAAFDSVINDSSLLVQIEDGNDHRATITCSRSRLDALETKVDGNTLIITQRQPKMGPFPLPTVSVNQTCHMVAQARALGVVDNTSLGDIKVTTEKLWVHSIFNSGSGTVSVARANADNVHISNASTGDIRVESVDAADMTVVNSGSGTISVGDARVERPQIRLESIGDINIQDLSSASVQLLSGGSGSLLVSGSTQDESTVLDSIGDIHADGLVAQRVTVTSNGSGTASLHASQEVTITLSSLGDIRVRGNPRTRNVDDSGSGDVTFE